MKADPAVVAQNKRARMLTNIFMEMYKDKVKQENLKIPQKDIRAVAQFHAKENMNNPEIIETYEEHKTEPKAQIEESIAAKMLRKIRGLK